MTFKDFLITIKDKYPNAKNEVILSAVNDLEEKLTTEILLPAGLGGQKAPLDLLNTDTELQTYNCTNGKQNIKQPCNSTALRTASA